MTTASDVPVREPGTRSRSGNTMAHTRAALLQATSDCVARYGVRKTTMVDVASKSGVAKATLYNHFRTKDDVLVAFVEQWVTELVAAAVATAGSEGLEAALHEAAESLAASAPLRKVAADEPALLAPLLREGNGRGWGIAREGVAAVLAAARVDAGPDQVELVLRWFTSQLLWPATSGAHQLLAGLAPGPTLALAPARVVETAAAPGLGWPS